MNDIDIVNKKSLCEAALYYAEKGWLVFPVYGIDIDGQCACGRPDCPSPGKHPLTANGFHDATTDPERIQKWWSQYPSANIGIRTGEVSGIVVIDIDKEKGGCESYDMLEKEHPDAFPVKTVAYTGGGGLHFCYKHPGFSITSRSNAFGEKYPGIDIRGDGGYIVVSPSLHISGRRYEWMSLNGLPDIPACLMNLIKQGTNKASDRQVTRDTTVIHEGKRNDALASIAGKYHNLGLDKETLLELVLLKNTKLCKPPLSEKEVTGIVDSISKYPRLKPLNYIASGESEILQPNLLFLDEIDIKDIDWLWQDFIPLGKLTLFVGNPDCGKSSVSLYIAAKVTTGNPWPNHSVKRKPGSVVILSAEDTPSDTIRPRFEACGGDSKRAIYFDGMIDAEGTNYFFNIRRDINDLEEVLRQHSDIKLIIIDPLVAYLTTDTHVDAKVRAVLGPLAKIASEYEVAVVGICHFNKSYQKNIIYKLGGSIAFAAAARSVVLVADNPKDPGTKIFHTIKSNLTPDKYGYIFRIEEKKVVFDPQEITLSPEDLIATCTPKKSRPATSKAAQWLEDYFKNSPGQVKSTLLYEEGKKSGFSRYALDQGCKMLGIKRRKIGNDETGYWELYLPKQSEETEDCD